MQLVLFDLKSQTIQVDLEVGAEIVKLEAICRAQRIGPKAAVSRPANLH